MDNARPAHTTFESEAPRLIALSGLFCIFGMDFVMGIH